MKKSPPLYHNNAPCSRRCHRAFENNKLISASELAERASKRLGKRIQPIDIIRTCHYAEWHHIGKKMNRYYFYDRRYCFTEEELKKLLSVYEKRRENNRKRRDNNELRNKLHG